MSLLPKSIHRCRRYPTKFNSGRDIPYLRDVLFFELTLRLFERLKFVRGDGDVEEKVGLRGFVWVENGISG